ncbi:MAG: hypothetical protein R2822_06360 [Spirosomataceae bacterium]
MRAELGNPNFDYEIACTEVCGQGHFAMRLRLIVADKATVDAWKQQQKPLLSTILEAAKFISKIPEKLRAKAMDYAPYVETKKKKRVQQLQRVLPCVNKNKNLKLY